MMNECKLWYDHPAAHWSQGLPIGNGRIGAVICGGIERESWSMTEVTYWSGRPERVVSAFKGKADLERIRQHFFSGNFAEGDRLAKELLQPQKPNFGTNLPLCELKFAYKATGTVTDFIRELLLDQAISRVSYQLDGAVVNREVFATQAGDIVASRIWADRPGMVSFTLGIEGSTEAFEIETASQTLHFKSCALEKVHSDGTCGVRSQGLVHVQASGGAVFSHADKLVVSDADEAWIYFAVGTDYQAGDRWHEIPEQRLETALVKGYDQLREEHVADYRGQYDKVNIQLGLSEQATLPTDERIRMFREGQDRDPQLFALFLQYGRYLTISGSRASSPLPMHLQGIWNDGEACRMGWSCDYHLDINTEMNYFPTEVTNLAESHLPLMRYIQSLAQAGRTTAEDFYGCEGWVAHVFSNAWGFTAPGWETSWGLNVTGGLWIARQMIEHYEFNQDIQFLRQAAYPVLKDAAAFFLEYMTVHPDYGWLVTGPSNSPENHFYGVDRSQGVQQLSMGPTLDQALVRDLFTFCLQAAGLLQIDDMLQQRWKEAIAKLPPLQVGGKGQLQEWLEDYEEAQLEHRHLSHLYALYPSSQITPEGTPEWSKAARVSLENRMLQDELEDIEFTAALFGLNFARLHDGERAYHHISHLVGELCFDNLLTYSKPGIAGAESNIFVIDGNFGGTAAIAEMLLQSHTGVIHLLPALPQAWQTGSVQGFRAIGNVEIDMAWEKGLLTEAVVRTFSTSPVVIRFGEYQVRLDAEPGGLYRLDSRLNLQ